MRTGIILCWLLSSLALTRLHPEQTSLGLVRRHGNHDETGEHDHRGEHNHESEPDCGLILNRIEYDMPLHIGSLFIIMAVSFIGCGVTASANFSKLPKVLVDIGRHFGTGVILSTAFVHMLTGAFLNLTDECAPKSLRKYTGFAPLIALGSCLLMHLMEFSAISKFNCRKQEETSSVGLNDQKLSLDSIGHRLDHGHNHFNMGNSSRDLTTYILELGILSHSIFIGITLGVTSGNNFISLLIAIAFHQFFEGVGLGARISEIQVKNWCKPALMVLMFSITTSIGIAIGILIRSGYSSTSSVSLTVQGVFDSISAGILIYTGLVDLVGRELSIDSDFGKKPWSIRILYLIALYLGVASMAVIGVWA